MREEIKTKRAREGAGKFRRPFPRASANWRQTTNRRRDTQKENEFDEKAPEKCRNWRKGKERMPLRETKTRRPTIKLLNASMHRTTASSRLAKLGCRSRSFFLSLAFTCDLGLECGGTANTQILLQYVGTHVLYTNTPIPRLTLETCTHWTHGRIATRFPTIAAHSQDWRRLATR